MYHSYSRSYIRGTTCSQVAHLEYPGYEHLKTVFRDEFISQFCEKPSLWGGFLNTPCSGFAKGPRFLNMVMTFTPTPRSHYNSITKPRARFLLSLMKDLSIDFPSHFITSIIECIRISLSVISLSFLRLSRESFSTSPFLFLSLLFSPSRVPPASTKVAMSGDGWSCSFCCSAFFFNSLHLCSFFLGNWCDSWCYNGITSEDGYSSQISHRWDVSNEHTSWLHCPQTGLHG